MSLCGGPPSALGWSWFWVVLTVDVVRVPRAARDGAAWSRVRKAAQRGSVLDSEEGFTRSALRWGRAERSRDCGRGRHHAVDSSCHVARRRGPGVRSGALCSRTCSVSSPLSYSLGVCSACRCMALVWPCIVKASDALGPQ